MEARPLFVLEHRKDNCKKKTLFLFHSLCLILFSAAVVATSSLDGIIIAEEDYQGLQAFKHAINDPRGFLRSWNDTGLGACSGAWFGIKCVKGKVIAIQLPWRGLGGHISEKIGQLTALRKLSLHNNLIGGQIPSAVGFLSDLRGLILFNNRFSGEVPPSIGNCLKLRTLDLSNNSLSGKIPPSISNSSKLYRLNLSFNHFSGEIPADIAKSPALTFLSLQHNALSGPIPHATAYKLQYLNLDENHLSGPIPASLGQLRLLKEITLSNNQLNGSIPKEIGSLLMLKTLDISQNSIGGSFSASLCNLSSLLKLNLAGNSLNGRLPDSLDKLGNLSVLSLKMNQLNGELPSTMGSISNLSLLDLSENNFTGHIPASLSHLSKLTFLNVSDNNLSGRVPALLSERFNSSSFIGNINLCGYSSSTPCPANLPPPPSSPPESHRRRLNTRDIIIIGAGIVIAFLFLLCCALLCFLIRKRATFRKQRKSVGGTEKAGQAAAEADTGGDSGGKLVHFDGPLVFTADDLLCATAEIMGKSTYGTVYKATLEDGNLVAVKRLREKIAKSQKEFEAEVNVLGKIRHLNLLALRAYYLGPKGEKLLVFDFMTNGSLAAFLHARGPDTPIDWPTRMSIAMGTARGLSHLHNNVNIIHGNLTSSNVLLDDNYNVKIADYGLSRLMTAAANSNVIATAGALGFRAPELSKLKKASTKTDVYSLGVIMLELLTGKSPGDAVNGADLPQWVASIVKEEWTNEVFDLELMKDAAGNAGDELLNTLKLALHCVDPSPGARPEVREVLQQLEEIKPELAVVVEEGGGEAVSAGD
ncbi:probably inactive leucine-rich repeat receptor-like protein kinase IMK2 [Dendrobium catenatum]|uniref:Inactive leucine-rich repeat receptor-like protein kinase IMK2 n=1 Tax=Dendrobium catenatum TaxID=906689 RepID=A0A2I0VFQ1_9ASPA|nr:probably inactive leucine-rich repeat receptor-like protein kinase IMK2 [Dendrobium catenatum]PKU62203.1 inactive leucine-rich repeat receptor-like protein kinase IMK2 [Dendrobium catenatum]